MNAGARKAGRILVWMLPAVLLLAVGAYCAVGAVAANALTMPRREFAAGVTPAKVSLTYEDVRFAARDGAADIAGWLIPSKGDAPNYHHDAWP